MIFGNCVLIATTVALMLDIAGCRVDGSCVAIATTVAGKSGPGILVSTTNSVARTFGTADVVKGSVVVSGIAVSRASLVNTS